MSLYRVQYRNIFRTKKWCMEPEVLAVVAAVVDLAGAGELLRPPRFFLTTIHTIVTAGTRTVIVRGSVRALVCVSVAAGIPLKFA
jgi:hypothetical protein